MFTITKKSASLRKSQIFDQPQVDLRKKFRVKIAGSSF